MDIGTPFEKEFDLLVFIGRFQPFHVEHKRIIDIALEKAERVLVLVGSAGSPRTPYNPFTFQERSKFILENYPHNMIGTGSEWGTQRVFVEPLYDKLYNNSAWIKQVQDIVDN